jgi:DnaJ-class molecular chaperone
MDHSTARKILGVSEEASFEETRHRFRALAKSHHPDLNPGKDSADFVLVSAAYLVLQGRQAGISKNEDAVDYASYAASLGNSIGRYFDDMMSNFIRLCFNLRAS